MTIRHGGRHGGVGSGAAMAHVAVARRGLSIAEVGVVVVLIAFLILIGVTVIPIQREASRETLCRAQLARIGLGLNVAIQAQGRLPVPPAFGPLAPPASSEERAGLSPQMAIQAVLRDSSPGDASPPPRNDRARPDELRKTRDPFAALDTGVTGSGWVCPSDARARDLPFAAAISYRAVAGDDPEGRNGLFAPGTLRTYEEVQEAVGASYTAAFVERRLGNGRDGVVFEGNYAWVEGSVGPETPVESARSTEFWRGDAGSDRTEVSWRSTLANFASTPGRTRGGVIARDQRTAKMTGSSDHPNRVHVLTLDGRVQAQTPSIDLKVWKALAHPFDSRGLAASPRLAEPPSPVPPS